MPLLSRYFNSDDFTKAIKAAQNPDGDPAAITALLPAILEEQNAAAATALLARLIDNNAHWMPEAFVLLGVGGLRANRKRGVVRQVFGYGCALDDTTIDRMADLSGKLGRIGFSFPAWRFLSARFGEEERTLLEHFGWKRLWRGNDIRDIFLPKNDPQHDEFGAGFVRKTDGWRVEYRRAYVAISHMDTENPVHLVVRNSAYHFGRDRIEHPVLVSFLPLDVDQLEKMDQTEFSDPDVFIPWQDILYNVNGAKTMDLQEKIACVERAVSFLELEDYDLSLGMMMDGEKSRILIDFLQEKLDQYTGKARSGAPLYLGILGSDFPPWRPQNVLPVDRALIQALKDHRRGRQTFSRKKIASFFDALCHGGKAVFLSSPEGDYPVKPKLKLHHAGARQTLAGLGNPDPEI